MKLAAPMTRQVLHGERTPVREPNPTGLRRQQTGFLPRFDSDRTTVLHTSDRRDEPGDHIISRRGFSARP
jgi:hypothetical protein